MRSCPISKSGLGFSFSFCFFFFSSSISRRFLASGSSPLQPPQPGSAADRTHATQQNRASHTRRRESECSLEYNGFISILALPADSPAQPRRAEKGARPRPLSVYGLGARGESMAGK